MANTRMSAKNSFLEGLILDISPENMSATSMSSALNATLLTFNGNEMILQNDMGNGRVETAFLPEGYVPVGTCEFGDIIYIVSYNPLINKSQIGCFPSPERNISTEEIGGLGQSLSWQDFLEGASSPNGKLKNTSVKKILYDNRDMTPGDKYIIYSKDLYTNKQNLSDYGNSSHKHETFPKLVKIHVVSIEESGKIVYLDSTTRWYINEGSDEYYLSDKGEDDVTGKIDLDSYRDLLNSGYSVFSSKVSGKLALLIELEKITGFSCAWEAYSQDNKESDNTKYSIYMHYNWTTEHNDINPDGVALLVSEWKDGKYYKWQSGDPLILNYDSPSSMTFWPTSSETSRYTEISRHYEPENIGTDYNAYLLTNYEYKLNLYKDSHKLNIIKDSNGIPTIGEYFIDCIKVEGNTYYGKNGVITSKKITDSIVNNYFHYPVIKHFADFIIPTRQTLTYKEKTIYKEPDITNLIYHYKIAPTMPYGILEEYAQEGYIDFSKLGKKHINLNIWKYYNYENTSTLTWGMEAYTEPNKGIQEIVFEFYDNNGFVAAYHTKDKLSYNGVFTEYLTLNESGTNYKLNNLKAFDTKPTYHKGLEVTKETAVPGFKYLKEGDTDEYENWKTYDLIPDTIDGLAPDKYYMDDSGTLYSNCLYLVKIIIKYCNKNILNEYIEIDKDKAIIDYRWYWTNNMFNEYYYQEKDFKNLLATLTLDGIINYEGTDKWNVLTYNYISNTDGVVESINSYKSLSSIVLYVNDKDNIKMTVEGGLIEDYNTFNILNSPEALNKISCNIYFANEYLENSPEKPEVIFSDKETIIYEGVYPILANLKEYKGIDELLKNLSPTLNKLINPNYSISNNNKELWDSEDSYKKYINVYKIDCSKAKDEKELNYIRYNGEVTDSLNKYKYIKSNLNEAFTKGFTTDFSGIHFSKYYYQTEKLEKVGQLRPFVLNENDLQNYNIAYYNNQFFFNKALIFSLLDEGGDNTAITGAICLFDSPNSSTSPQKLSMTNSKGEDSDDGGNDVDIPASIFLRAHNDTLVNNFKFLFPVVIAHYYDGWGTGNVNAYIEKNGKTIVSNNKEVRIDTTSWSNSDLGGTLAGISSDGTIELGNHFVSKSNSVTTNALLRFIPNVLGYLTLFYYMDNTPYMVDVPNNYVYLNDNNITYTRDIVLELSIADNVSVNDLILFKKYLKLSKYIEEVLSDNSRGTKATSDDINVNFILKSCQKNCPIVFKFNYIKPSMLYSSSNYVLIKSCFSEIPKILSGDFNPLRNTIYAWDFKLGCFKHCKEALEVNIATYKINDKGNIEGTVNNTSYRNINKYSLQFDIDAEECLQFRNIPNSGSNTYKVITHKDGWGISNLKTNLKYF